MEMEHYVFGIYGFKRHQANISMHAMC